MVVSSRSVIGFGRITPNCTFTASSAAAGFPASNLGILPVGVVHESVGLANYWVRGEYDITRAAQLFLLTRWSVTNQCEFRLRLYGDTAAIQADLLYDSDADTELVGGKKYWPVVYGDVLDWEDDNLIDGQYTEAQKADMIYSRPIWLPRRILHRSWRLDFTDPSNLAGKFVGGHVEIARGHQLSRGIARGSEESFEPRTTKVTARGGANYFDRRTKPMTFSGDLRSLPNSEAQDVIFECQKQYDLDQPFAWIKNPSDPTTWLREGGLYHFEDLSPRQRASKSYRNARLNLIQAF